METRFRCYRASVLTDKRILITGIATNDSIAFAAAKRCQALGAEVLVTAFGRDLEAATEVCRDLERPPVEIVAVDLTDDEHLVTLDQAIERNFGEIDGALHAVAFAPRTALSGDFLAARAVDVELAFRTSAYSYMSMARVVADRAPATGASVVGLDFDSTTAWPIYNWMGVCKSALESVNRYLARDLGARRIRSNLVAAGPLLTRAGMAIPGFTKLLDAWVEQSPLHWAADDPMPTADAVCFLLSDFARGITGEILHVDGGFHAVAARLADREPSILPPLS